MRSADQYEKKALEEAEQRTDTDLGVRRAQVYATLALAAAVEELRFNDLPVEIVRGGGS